MIKKIPDPAECKTFDYVTPTLASKLSDCMYKAGQRASHGLKDFFEKSPPALIGTVAHRTIERAYSGNFEKQASSPEENFERTAEKIWKEEVRGVIEENNVSEEKRGPKTWPGYGMKKARTVKMVANILEKTESSAFSSPHKRKNILEKKIGSSTEGIIGRPDRVLRKNSKLIVEDFKTGSIRDESGEVREQYRRQILMYSWLVGNEMNQWPEKARLVPLEGDVYEETPDKSEAEKIADRSLELIEKYNQAVKNSDKNLETQAEKLAEPSVEHCRWCSVRPWCNPYWNSFVPEKMASEYRRDIQGRLETDWEPPKSMKLVDAESDRNFVLGINPDIVTSEEKVPSQTLIRCINAEIDKSGESYLADSNSEIWFREKF